MNLPDTNSVENRFVQNTIIFSFEDELFEWDADKAKINIDKHGIHFEEAVEAFFDPNYQEGDANDNDENRSFILGYSRRNRLLYVVNVERGDRIRIISARLAETYERNMKMLTNEQTNGDEEPLKIMPRPQQQVTLSMPTDVVTSLDAVAQKRDTSRDALIRFYIGSGLRQDLSQMFSEKVMETTAQVLSRHQISDDAAEEIIKEIRREIRPASIK